MGKRMGEAFAGIDELMVMGTPALRRGRARLQPGLSGSQGDFHSTICKPVLD